MQRDMSDVVQFGLCNLWFKLSTNIHVAVCRSSSSSCRCHFRDLGLEFVVTATSLKLRILVSITFFHLPVTLPSFPDHVLPHLSLVQSHKPKSFNYF